jgi:hypothetical protein
MILMEFGGKVSKQPMSFGSLNPNLLSNYGKVLFANFLLFSASF